MVGVLWDDMTRFLWTGKTAASALTIAMVTSSSPQALAILSQRWAEFTAGIIAPSGSPYVTWSPLIRTDNERAEFESFIMELGEKGYFTGGNPVCLLCSGEDQRYINPLEEVDFPGTGKFSCSLLEESGLN
jgi:hypothetical protein